MAGRSNNNNNSNAQALLESANWIDGLELKTTRNVMQIPKDKRQPRAMSQAGVL
jgi:hypothetical protein